MNPDHDLVAFLRARLDEDEAAARDALRVMSPGGLYVGSFCVHLPPEVQQHNDRHDPARALREVAAHRALLDHHTGPGREPETAAELHARCAHPAYEYATTEGQRKAWDNIDVPPEGDGWERNTDRGRDGWDRFDYTEESYWRRLRPDGPRPPYIPIELRILATMYADHPDYRQDWTP